MPLFVLTGALELADEIGIDGMVDLVFAEIDLPDPALPWKEAIRRRCASARVVLARHRWAAPSMESRTSPGPALLTHHDAVLGCLRRAMSIEMTAHASAMLDADVYGFAMQEASLPATGGAEMAELATEMIEHVPADRYPHLFEFTVEHVVQPDDVRPVAGCRPRDLSRRVAP